jgi:hypothetical protein
VAEVADGADEDSRAVLGMTFDRDAESWETASGWYVISSAVYECRYARRLIARARKQSRNTPQMMLAYWVGAALQTAGVELTKSRTSTFGRVLSIVWASLEPNGGPEDVYPYVRKAVDAIRRMQPGKEARKGRPRDRK